ncbi:hypothetical protein QBC37DRAFT_407640, partial [Rhypophila decipiens]
LRLDQAGENTSDEVKLLCSDRGISLETTGTEQHQSNGVAEVTIRLITERTHAVLDSAQLDKKYWPFIAESAGYLRNLTPHRKLGKTPYEAWFGDKPDISHLRALGSRGFAKQTGARKKLLDDKGVPCRLLGYQGAHIYKVLTDDGRILLSSNVVFTERRACHGHPTDKGTREEFTQSAHPTKRVAGQPSHPAKRVAGQPSHPAQRVAGQPSHPAQRVAGQPSHPAQRVAGQPSHPAERVAEQPSHTTESVATQPSGPAAPTKDGGGEREPGQAMLNNSTTFCSHH